MTVYGMLIDRQACVGCRTCVAACKVNNSIPAGIPHGREYYRIWPREVERGEFPYVIRNLTLMLCMHCEEAPCVAACPEKAIYRREDGLVLIHEGRCTGCGECISECPYGALYIRQDKGVVDKCNFCAANLAEGRLPECVTACPADAIHFGDIADTQSEISRLIRNLKAQVIKPKYGTKPHVFYTPQAARLRGRVTNRNTGQGTPSIEVTVKGPGAESHTTLTDDRGTFFFWRLRQGSSYRLNLDSFSLAITLNDDYVTLEDIVICV
jgi:tetrathionate reductase subunit B